MANPWSIDVFSVMKHFVRFVGWLCISVIGLMVSVFLVCFTYKFLHHLWEFCLRTIFAEQW